MRGEEENEIKAMWAALEELYAQTQQLEQPESEDK